MSQVLVHCHSGPRLTFFHNSGLCLCFLTFKVALGLQVSHTKAKDWQFVQTRATILREGQEVREAVQLPIQPIPVPLWRVWFDNLFAVRDFLSVEQKQKKTGLVILIINMLRKTIKNHVGNWRSLCCGGHNFAMLALNHTNYREIQTNLGSIQKE